LLVSAVDPLSIWFDLKGVVRSAMLPPDVTIHTGRMTVHTRLNVTLWWLTQVRRSKGGYERHCIPLPKCWGCIPHPPAVDACVRVTRSTYLASSNRLNVPAGLVPQDCNDSSNLHYGFHIANATHDTISRSKSQRSKPQGQKRNVHITNAREFLHF